MQINGGKEMVAGHSKKRYQRTIYSILSAMHGNLFTESIGKILIVEKKTIVETKVDVVGLSTMHFVHGLDYSRFCSYIRLNSYIVPSQSAMLYYVIEHTRSTSTEVSIFNGFVWHVLPLNSCLDTRLNVLLILNLSKYSIRPLYKTDQYSQFSHGLFSDNKTMHKNVKGCIVFTKMI